MLASLFLGGVCMCAPLAAEASPTAAPTDGQAALALSGQQESANSQKLGGGKFL